MIDLRKIYNAFNADEPLPGTDNARYVDLRKVRGNNDIPKRLLLRIENSNPRYSYTLLRGHNKCGKTTELNKARLLIDEAGYVTVMFDVAESAARTFEYTTVMLLMAAYVIEQLSKRPGLLVRFQGASTKELADFLVDKEVTATKTGKVDAEAGVSAKAAPGLITKLLGEFGLSAKLSGGFQNSRSITRKIEGDTAAFKKAISAVIQFANDEVKKKGKKGLVIICDGCDKLDISATDEEDRTRDLQISLFVDHAPDLQSIPCHVIYTVPISTSANLADHWEHSSEFVPAVPINALPGIDQAYASAGRALLKEVIVKRIEKEGHQLGEVFESELLIEGVIDASGGHISDLLILVREAVLQTQIENKSRIGKMEINQAIRDRLRDYTALIEAKYLKVLTEIEQLNTCAASSEYRELVFKRLVLEYISESRTIVDLHPLVKISEPYQKWQR
jgi:hypothetical protein